MDIKESKQALRKSMIQQRNFLPEASKKEYDHWICEALHQSISDHGFKMVHTYLPMGSEVDLRPLIAQLLAEKIQIVTPKTLGRRKLQHLVLNTLNELEKGKFGTKHPANSKEYLGEYDLIIVPGLAFDTSNYRLGYGGGYYDAFIDQHPEAQKIGIAYPFQLLDQVPRENHDQQLDQTLVNPALKLD